MQQICRHATMWSSSLYFKDKPACILHSVRNISLNLVGVCAAESCVGAVSFFWAFTSNVQLFSVSTPRWEIMLQYVEDFELVVKRVNNTRCARADATMALFKAYRFQKALQVVVEDMTQKLQVIHEVKCLLIDFSNKENIRAGLRAVVLNRIKGVNKSLQMKSIKLQTALNLLKSLLKLLDL
ncbi:TTF-type domain-containing protein [Trichonephila clavipes]|nr:TTF-type domain-containing protein [Trichonephila clavipes]